MIQHWMLTLSFLGTKAHLLGADERKYSIFDIDILCEKARFQLSQFRSKWQNFKSEMILFMQGIKI